MENQRLHFNVKLKKSKTDYKPLKLKNFLSKPTKSTTNTTVKYNSSSIVKFINGGFDHSMYFLRKNKSFNKGRYSRNRQNYRTGVYWCLYVNIIALFGLYFLFYRFTFNFGYLWWLLYCLPASLIIPQMIRNRLYNPTTLYNMSYNYLMFICNTIHIIFFNKK